MLRNLNRNCFFAMKKYIVQLCALLVLSLGIFSCKKDYEGLGPLEDSIAEIPVTVVNKEFHEFVPIVTTSQAAGGNFSITFEIPADKGTIREITRVGTGANGSLIVSTRPIAQTFNYNTATQQLAPIQGNGTNRITFTSTLALYTAYRTRVAALGVNAGNPGTAATGTPPVYNEAAPNQLRYFFQLTLGDGTTVVPTEVRVRVLP